jgi:hypothetical protein
MSGRVRRGPRRIIVTDGHEADALAALRGKRHSRIGRFFLELVGWPVARPLTQAGHSSPTHLRRVHDEHPNHFSDPVCGTCGARHRTEHPPPSTR